MNPYRSLLIKWARHPSFIFFGRKIVYPLDRLLQKTGRPMTAFGTGMPTVYLTSTGRRSGQDRTVPLLAVDIPTGVGLIDSNFGTDARPAWYFNLMANPHCRLQRGKETKAYVARDATLDERAQIWRRGVEIYPAWETYAERISRDLDMFVLEPAR